MGVAAFAEAPAQHFAPVILVRNTGAVLLFFCYTVIIAMASKC